jgi:hypothetical protein
MTSSFPQQQLLPPRFAGFISAIRALRIRTSLGFCREVGGIKINVVVLLMPFPVAALVTASGFSRPIATTLRP